MLKKIITFAAAVISVSCGLTDKKDDNTEKSPSEVTVGCRYVSDLSFTSDTKVVICNEGKFANLQEATEQCENITRFRRDGQVVPEGCGRTYPGCISKDVILFYESYADTGDAVQNELVKANCEQNGKEYLAPLKKPVPGGE